MIAEQVELYETLTGEHAGVPPSAAAGSRSAERRRPPLPQGGRGGDEGRGAQGRPLAGARRLAALRGPGRGRARAARPRGRSPIDVGADLVKRLRRRAARRRLRRPARRRRRGRHRRRSCSRSSASPSPGPASPPARAAWTRSLAKHALREAGHPDPGLVRLQRRPPSASSAPPTRSSEIEETPRLPAGRQAEPRRLLARGQVRRARAARCPQALVSAFSYDDRVLLERFVDGPRAGGQRARRRAAAGGRGDPARGRPLRLRGPLRDRPHRLRLPGRAERRGGARRHRGRARAPTSRSAAPASPAST